jgi:hypothetical protein
MMSETEERGWRDIATVPKDGTRILGYGRLSWDAPGILKAGAVVWESGKWVIEPNENTEYDSDACDLTHWMPLPAPPAQKPKGAGAKQ